MKQTLVLAALIAAVCGKWEQGLRAHFDTGILGLGFGNSFMYNLPKSLSDAKNADWKQESRPADGLLPSLPNMYCHSPPIMCIVYDDNGFAAMLQISLLKKGFTNNAYDMPKQGFISWTDSNGNDYWATQLLLISEDYLTIDKDERLASHVSGNVLQQDSVWVTGTNHELYTIPNNTVDIAKTDFTVQACIPWMGLHYYYKMTPDTECSAETLLPWFPMYDDGQLVGVGMMTYGSRAPPGNGEREWFENPSKSAIQGMALKGVYTTSLARVLTVEKDMARNSTVIPSNIHHFDMMTLIVNNGPTCLHNLGDNPGVHTMHIYFVENPRLILCLNN